MPIHLPNTLSSSLQGENQGKSLFGKDLFLRLVEIISYEKNPLEKTRYSLFTVLCHIQLNIFPEITF